MDAIAFDPDPIRGGKYVIQAKRYTRTVDVSAVRDLYGTVMHEGADRGILVTTLGLRGRLSELRQWQAPDAHQRSPAAASALTGQHGDLLPKGQVLEHQVVL